MIAFEGVSIRYGDRPPVFTDVSFSLAPGSFHFLTGPSGAGKSTLLRLMYLVSTPSAGHLKVFGKEISTLSSDDRALMRRKMGIVFQDFRLINHLSIFENVALPLRIKGCAEAQIKKDVRELLDWVGLATQMDVMPPTLSGGEQQRVAIARAVITRPSLILADEPTGNVDLAIGTRLMYLFEELNRMGTTLLIATHQENWITQRPHARLRIQMGTVLKEADF